ncbi:MAG: AAA family ATPase [Gammaproteobacteria bacterium]
MAANNPARIPYTEWVQLWLLRMLMMPAMLDSLEAKTGLCAEVSQLLGIDLTHAKQSGNDALRRKKLGTLLQRIERRVVKHSVRLFKNIDKLRAILSLTDAECMVMAFFVLVQEHDLLSKVTALAGEISTPQLIGWLAKVLNQPARDIRHACQPSGTLTTAGMLEIMPSARFNISMKVNTASSLEILLDWDTFSPDDVLSLYARTAPAAERSFKDFDYLNQHLAVIVPLLKNASRRRIPAVNVLIYGKPGTGKTELIRTIARKTKIPLYEVNFRNREGQSLDSKERMAAYAVAQRVLTRRDGILLFDEIEDVFPRTSFFSPEKPVASKAWINRMLETNPVPTVWVSNDIWQLDKAYLRRFDYVLEIKAPPLKQRVKLLRRHLHNQSIDTHWLERVASHNEITPGHIQRVGRVLHIAGIDLEADHAGVANNALAGTLKAMGIPQVPKLSPANATTYRLSYLNASIPLEGIIGGLTQRPEGRLCLYGPPGTGKTEFAHHLAKQIGLPLIKKRASDILTPWLGETERNLASMFEEAVQDDAVLLLDEADSFLRDRGMAQRSWEITQVNELLTQMESYQGIFICSTNLMEYLDTASLRRFDFKIGFDYLRQDQRQMLYFDMLSEFGEGAESLSERTGQRLRKLDRLTPGDFAVALRQARLSGVKLTPDTLLSVLETECALKEHGKKPFLGFGG